MWTLVLLVSVGGMLLSETLLTGGTTQLTTSWVGDAMCFDDYISGAQVVVQDSGQAVPSEALTQRVLLEDAFSEVPQAQENLLRGAKHQLDAVMINSAMNDRFGTSQVSQIYVNKVFVLIFCRVFFPVSTFAQNQLMGSCCSGTSTE